MYKRLLLSGVIAASLSGHLALAQNMCLQGIAASMGGRAMEVAYVNLLTPPVSSPAAALAHHAPAYATATPPPAPATARVLSRADEVVGYAQNFIGTPYRYGGTTTQGFDCSGFVRFAFGEFGIEVPHHSASMLHTGQAVARAEVRKGDIVLFNNVRGRGVSHSGIVAEVSAHGVFFLHASCSRGVTMDNLFADPYWSRRIAKIVRVLPAQQA